MNGEYKVETPADFKSVITNIFDWHKNSGQGTLIIALKGNLGAGKTTFTQILGQYLDIKDQITSPTFTIMKQYEIENKDFDKLVHIDAYRIEKEDEVGPLRLNEVFERPRTILCVEWPEQIPSVIPDSAVWVEIEIGDGETRKVKVS